MFKLDNFHNYGKTEVEIVKKYTMYLYTDPQINIPCKV